MPGRLRSPPATRSVPSCGSASGGLRGELQVSRIFGKRNKNICQFIDRACFFVLLVRTCLFLFCRFLEINNEVCSLHLMGRVVHKPLGIHVVFELLCEQQVSSLPTWMLVELLGIRSWLELSFGTSWKAYNGMDTYVSMWHHGMEPPPTEAWYLLNSSRLVQFRSRYEPHIFFTRNLPRPRHSHTPHFRAGRGQLHPMLGAPYCIARHRHPDAAQAWHSAACVRDCNCSIVLVFKRPAEGRGPRNAEGSQCERRPR